MVELFWGGDLFDMQTQTKQNIKHSLQQNILMIMEKHFKELAKSLNPGVHYIMVVGASSVSNVLFETDEFLSDIAERNNFTLMDKWGYQIKNRYMRFVDENTAKDVFNQMKLDAEDWKTISGKTIFIIRGTGTAAKSLKSAIEKEDIGMYTDVKVLEAVQTLPNGSRAKMIAVGIAKPSPALINTIRQMLNRDDFEKLNRTLKMADAQLVVGGLYSMYRIDIAEVMGMLNGRGSFSNLDTGFLLMVKSGLPGFMFQPILRNYLIDSKFEEVKTGGYSIYKGSWDITNAGKLHAMLRIDGSYAYAAVAGKESYAETLITNIRK